MNRTLPQGDRRHPLLAIPVAVYVWLAERFRPGRHAVCWVLAFFLGGYHLTMAWKVDGYVTCDFAGQWSMGRFYYTGRVQDLYLNTPRADLVAEGLAKGWSPGQAQRLGTPQRRIMEEGYDGFHQEGDHLKKMIRDVLDKNSPDCTVEGALYPPPAGLFFWPFAILKPQASHAVIVTLYLLLTVLNGWFISKVTHARVQWGEAVLLIFACPNTYQMFLLGQNSMLSLTLLCAGWYCLHRDWPVLAGLVWGGLAFKPVFALSCLLVPLLLPNWRMLCGMVAGGLLLCLATLPFTGYHGLDQVPKRLFTGPDKKDADGNPIWPINPTPEEAQAMNPWERWLITGKNSALIYSRDTNWVWMSRDLVGLPRRRMWEGEDLYHTWKYNYERYFEGKDTWGRQSEHKARRQWEEQRERDTASWQKESSASWPETRQQQWRAETQRRLEEYDAKAQEQFDALLGKAVQERGEEWSRHHQLVYVEIHDSENEEVRQATRALVRQATYGGFALLGGFLALTAATALATWLLPRRHGLPPLPQAKGSRSALLLLGGVLGCWHFMYYDLLLCVLPLCLLLADLSKRSWPPLPGLLLALLLQFLFHLAVGPGDTFLTHFLAGPWSWAKEFAQWLLGGVWWLRLSLLLQLGFGVWGLVMVHVRRRWSWLLLLAVVLLQLTAAIIGGIGFEYEGHDLDEVKFALGGALTLIPLLAMLPWLGGRLWLALLTTLFLLFHWDQSFGYGITRFPFETIVALGFWGMAGLLALQEMRRRIDAAPAPATAGKGTMT